MSAGEKDATAVTRLFARVTATLSRRLACLAVSQRPEVKTKRSSPVLSVPKGQDDCVALVTLNSFEVLNEEPLSGMD